MKFLKSSIKFKNQNFHIYKSQCLMSQQKLIREIKERIRENLSEGALVQLDLDSISIRQFTKQIKNTIEAYTAIQYLTLNDCELISLNNFPKLPNLTVLELSNNNIEDDQLFHLLKNSHISHLMIDENRLRSIEKVSILRQLPNLEQLEIANNLIGESDFYREELFDRIPQLKIIDCKDRYGQIAIDSESQGESDDNSMIGVGDNRKNTKNSTQREQSGSEEDEDDDDKGISRDSGKRNSERSMLALLNEQSQEKDEPVEKHLHSSQGQIVDENQLNRKSIEQNIYSESRKKIKQNIDNYSDVHFDEKQFSDHMGKKMFALRTETNDTYEKDDLSENNGSSGNDDFLCIVEEEEHNNNLEV